MRGASQIENPVKKSKTLLHKVNISMCIMSGSKRTILQVTKCTGTPSQMLFSKGSSEFVLKSF